MTANFPDRRMLPSWSAGVALQNIANKTMFDSEPDIILNSFPRSGNTFLHMGLRMSWPDLVIKSHLHDIAIYNNTDESVPLISIVRNPVDAISSWTIHATSNPHGENFLNINNSINFYESHVYFASMNHNVLIIPFDDLIADILPILDFIAKKYNLGDRVMHTHEEILAASKKLSQDISEEGTEYSKRGHVPRELDPGNALVREILLGNAYKDKLAYLESLYTNAVGNSYK